MPKRFFWWPLRVVFPVLIISISATGEIAQKPPLAKAETHLLQIHGEELKDDYYWLKDTTRSNPEVLAYLGAENSYASAYLETMDSLKNVLEKEIRAHTPWNDLSYPSALGDYYYYTKSDPQKGYMVYCRKPGGLEGDEQIILDPNDLAAREPGLKLAQMEISPDHRYLAFLTSSREQYYTLRIKDLEQNRILTEQIAPVLGFQSAIAWANDSRTLFYARQNELYKHKLGTDPWDDKRVFWDDTPGFWLDISRSKDGQYLFLNITNGQSNEFRFMPADDPLSGFTIIHPRETGMQYYPHSHTGRFFILTNADDGETFKIMITTVEQPAREHWADFIVPQTNVTLACDPYHQGLQVFRDYLVVEEQEYGLKYLWIIDLISGLDYRLDLPEPIYSVYTVGGAEFDSPSFRFVYESMTRPQTLYEYEVRTKRLEKLKELEVGLDYDPSAYQTQRVYAQAQDGDWIPVSLVYREDLFTADGTNPLLLTAYGAYGGFLDPVFEGARISLLDRGVVFAIAHVRGGGFAGPKWYDKGKGLNKKKTFTDFLSCADFLIQQMICAPNRIAGYSENEGGLILGYVANHRPHLFRSMVLDNPPMDHLNFVLEYGSDWIYNEYGIPHIKGDFDYIRSYCPYQNIKAQDYPPILAFADYYNIRLPYWTTVKWVAKLRAVSNPSNPLLLLTDMDEQPEESASEMALKYAFILKTLKVEK
ncbi:S9 family peptidase [bacterium]|nr:S9 family peptidase [bacterium]